MGKMVGIPAFCLGVVMIFFTSGSMSLWMAVWIFLLIIFVFGYAWRVQKITLLLWFLFSMSVGAGYGYARLHHALSQQWKTVTPSQSFDIIITELPEYTATKQIRFIAQATDLNGKKYRLLFRDYMKRDWQVGQHWRINARVRPPIGLRNITGFDQQAWALANGVDGIASVGKERFRLPEDSFSQWRLNRIRENIVQNWQTVSDDYPQGVALMKALSVGDKSGLSYQAWAAFRPLGLNHLVSISGLHITMVALLAVWLSKLVMRCYTPDRPYVVGLITGWLVALIYTGLAGFGIPALRSLLMLSVFVWSRLWCNYLSSWQIWWLSLAAVLLYQPMAVLAMGFWLSFGLVSILLWISAFRLPDASQQSFWQYHYGYFKKLMFSQYAMTLISGVATIYLFGFFAIFSPLVNIVAIPFFSWILVPLALLASFLPFDFLKIVAACLGEYTLNILIDLGTMLPEMTLPHVPIELFFLAIASVFILLLPNGLRLKPLAIVLLSAFILYRPPRVADTLKVTVWDVGQGLSVLMQTSTQNILYDTGKASAEIALLPNLRAVNVRSLNTLILSHHDDDHDGGFSELARTMKINQIYAGQPEFYDNALPCQRGISWTKDNVKFEFLMLSETAKDNVSDNDLSCVLRVSIHNQAILLTGDISKTVESKLIQQYGNQLHSNILVLAHHGSKSSNSNAFLRIVAPQTAVASSGFANAFRHPHPDVQKALAKFNIQLLRTDLQGGIVFYLTKQGTFYQLLAEPKYWWQRKPFESFVQ